MDQFIDQDRELEIKKQQMTAETFFFQKTDQYIANERSRLTKGPNATKFIYNFHKIISSSLPNLPPCLQKNIHTKPLAGTYRKESDKIQVFVQLAPSAESSSCLSLDRNNNSIILSDPTPSRKYTASNAPKSFQVDTVINEDCPLIETCSNILNNVIRSVANGEDACVLSFGNVSYGEHNPMLGTDKSPSTLGIIPCAILWLFNYINIIKQHENSRFSVRISATEVSEKQEICRDLLAKISCTSSDYPMLASFSPLNTPVELRAVDAQKASFYLDYALSERSKSEYNGLSHILLTLHVYQYHMKNDSGIIGGRSRLHFIDLGHGRLSENNESNALSIQGISKVILALWSGQRYIPNSDSYLTQLLRKTLMTSIGKIQTSMVFNISGKEVQYNEALQVVQLASKIFRHKIKSSKLSSPFISDDNSSSDSFSFRRMAKTKERNSGMKRSDRMSFSSDFDAASSSDVSCDTVIFRGDKSSSPPVADRGSADGSSQEYMKDTKLELEEKKAEIKLSLFEQKRRISSRTNSSAWPKVAVKKASQVIKSGQELWVDGPQAFCTDMIKNEKNEINEIISDNISLGVEQNNPTLTIQDSLEIETLDDAATRVKKQQKDFNKAQLSEMLLERYDYEAKNMYTIDNYGGESVLKSMMVTDWLSKQPEISEEINMNIHYSKNCTRNNNGNKLELQIKEKGNTGKTNLKTKIAQVERTKMPVESHERKNCLKNNSRIEEWIKSVSVESPKLTKESNEIDLTMAQSLYSPTFSPYHISKNHQPFFNHNQFNPQSVPLSYNANSYNCNDNIRGLSIPPDSVGSEIENECSRLWFFNQNANDPHSKPINDSFDDINNIRSSSFSSGVHPSFTRVETLHRSCHKSSTKNPLNHEILHMQQETLFLQDSEMKCNLQRYSTLPLNNYSPKHNRDNTKSIDTENKDKNNVNQICDISLKKSNKDYKKKESKKGFSFFNQLIRNKKSKKEVSANRSRKEECNNKTETSATEAISHKIMKQNDIHLTDTIDYISRAGPPLLLTSSYHTVTSPKTFNSRADSSGHGSDCSSFNGIKAAQVSVNFHPETSGFRFAAIHRAGSSGYESVVRDSELSSHNDSASECSAPTNVGLQSPTVQKSLICDVCSPSTTTLSQSLPNNEKEKEDNLELVQESQKVGELIMKEKISILHLEREEILQDLINVMRFYNIDPEISRKDLEKHVQDMDGNDQSTESFLLTNQMLRSVLNRYQNNLCIITSFLSNSEAESFCE